VKGKGLLYSTALVGILISMSNALGLVIVISLLGQGVVGVPRFLWGEGKLLRKLHYYEFQAKELNDKIEDTHLHMIKQLAVCMKCICGY
jgi:hypothetical protein